MARKARTRIAAGLGIVAGTVALAACSKPAPDVTAQVGSTSIVAKPVQYCFDGTKCHRYNPDVKTITAGANDTVLVDVPRKIVGQGWAVLAVDVDGKTQLGSSSALKGTHSYRLPASINDGKPFFVQVRQLKGTQTDGSLWAFEVKVDPTKS